MTTVEIYKKKKNELVAKTLDLLPIALSGDRCTVTFYFIFDEVNNELTVDYVLLNKSLSEWSFFAIKDYEIPDPADFGYESIHEMDFEACGYSERIENAIDIKIMLLEQYDQGR